MVHCLIAFGSNQGDPHSTFASAQSNLAQLSGVESVEASDLISTQPIGLPRPTDSFLNGAIRIVTSLQVDVLYQHLERIEHQLGRIRRGRWQSRTIDLDLLLYGELCTTLADLTIPHPRMSFRRFVLMPALQVAADMIHPRSGLMLRELIDHLDRTPQVLLWVNGNREAARQTIEQLGRTRTGAGQRIELDTTATPIMQTHAQNRAAGTWLLSTVDNCEQFLAASKSAKLVIYNSSQEFASDDYEKVATDLIELSRRFRGPTLDLASCDCQSYTLEIAAAMDAMVPIPMSTL